MSETHINEATSDAEAAERRIPRWQIHHRLYSWAIHWADTPYGGPAMAVLAFSEAIFFPVPADVLLLALCMGKPKRSFHYGLICVTFSILGGCTAFALGVLIGGERVIHVFDVVHLGGKAQQAMELYKAYDFWAVATAALTPVPYMMFSWLGGISNISFAGFAVTSMVFRSIRFFTEAVIIYFAGAKAKPWIDKYFNLATIIVIVLVALVFIAMRTLSKVFVQ